MKAVVKHMPGDRVSGYYYIGLEGTDFCLCRDGHPDFPYRLTKEQAEELCKRLEAASNV